MLAEKKNFLFIHIPKTAGNAIQASLHNHSEDRFIDKSGSNDRFALESARGFVKHSTALDYLRVLGPERFQSLRKFTCVRNPWERAISFYFSPHRSVAIWDKYEFVATLSGLPPMVSYLAVPPEPPFEGTLNCVDFTIRYETLARDFRRLCEWLEIPVIDLEIKNRSNHAPWWSYYDKELADLVAERYREDIELFQYSFHSAQNRG